MIKLLGKMLKIYEDEINLFFWSALLFFFIHVSDILLNNFGETTFLKRYGVEYLPIIYMVNAVCTFFIMGVLTGIMTTVPSSRVLFYMMSGAGISIGILRLVIPFGFDFIYPVLYVLKSQFEVLFGLLFWDMANDLFNTRQSKRLFPLLTAGGTMGAIIGSFSTPALARTISIDNVMWVYLATSFVGAVVVRHMGYLFPALVLTEKKSKKKSGVSMLEEIRKVIPITRESMLVKILIVLTLIPNMVIPMLNFMFNVAVDQAYGTEGGMIKFYGYFRGSMNIVSFLVLLFVGRIYGRWGLPIALMFHPSNYVIAFLAYLIRFDVFSAMYAQLSTVVLRNTINNPARAVLMGLFPAEYRAVVRPFLRGTVVRIGILFGSGTIMLCQGFMHPRYLSVVGIIMVSIWIATTIILKKRYSQILLDLISRNMLDMKSLEERDVSHIFMDKKIQSQLVEGFLSSKGETCLWYANLMRSLGIKNMDDLILSALKKQDDRTITSLLGLLSGEAGEKAVQRLADLVDHGKPELTIAAAKAAARMPLDLSSGFLKSVFETFDNPEIKAWAVIGLFRHDPETYRPVIDSWLASKDVAEKGAGIIAAGGTKNRNYLRPLVEILRREKDESIIALIVEALHLLEAQGLNRVASQLLKHRSEQVRRAALNALSVSDDDAMRAVIPLLGDSSTDIRNLATSKLHEASYQNAEVLIESLVAPDRRLRDGVFSLLESLQIKDVDVFRFARAQFERAYVNVAEAEALRRLGESPERDLLIDHLVQKKRERVETVLRVLAVQDRSGGMRMIHRGILSSDSRQRANAIEALEDSIGSSLSRGMIPLLEDLSPARCLDAGKKWARLPEFDSKPGSLYAHLLSKHDWVTVLLSLNLIEKEGFDGLDKELFKPLLQSKNPHIRERSQRLMKKGQDDSSQKETDMETGISIPDKILHLKGIQIFEGLSVSELAAIASVTEEVVHPKGSIIITEGETGETMYMIIAGEVAVIKGSEGGVQLELDHIRPGDYFGEMALFEGQVRSATIRSEMETRLLVLHKREFTEIVREYPLIALHICRVLSQRLRKLHEKIQFDGNGTARILARTVTAV